MEMIFVECLGKKDRKTGLASISSLRCNLERIRSGSTSRIPRITVSLDFYPRFARQTTLFHSIPLGGNSVDSRLENREEGKNVGFFFFFVSRTKWAIVKRTRIA